VLTLLIKTKLLWQITVTTEEISKGVLIGIGTMISTRIGTKLTAISVMKMIIVEKKILVVAIILMHLMKGIVLGLNQAGVMKARISKAAGGTGMKTTILPMVVTGVPKG
jgi:hypothetical protein